MSGNAFGDMVKDVATRERAKGETLDTFGELCVIEERVHALREVVPSKDWTPPPTTHWRGLKRAMDRANRLQAAYREALADMRQCAVREAQEIRNRLDMESE